MGTKNEPGKFDCYSKLEPNEPYFVLRAKDPTAWILVNLWVQMRRMMTPIKSPSAIAKMNEAKMCSDNMREYARTHIDNQGDRTIDAALDAYETLTEKSIG